MAKEKQRPRCHNCKYAGQQFKVGNMTHLHCLNPELYPPAECESGKISPWDTLREFWQTCDKHEPDTFVEDAMKATQRFSKP